MAHLTTTSESLLKPMVLLNTWLILCQSMGGKRPQLELLWRTFVADS